MNEHLFAILEMVLSIAMLVYWRVFCLDFSKGEGFLMLNEIQASTTCTKKKQAIVAW